MSSPTRTRVRRVATGLLAIATATTVSACGASLDAQTYQERPTAGGINDAVGTLALRNISIPPPPIGDVFPEGADVPMIFTVVNAATETDRLLEVTTPAAQEVLILDGTQREAAVLDLGGVGTTANDVVLLLRGLTRELRPGEYVAMTFRFAENGTAELLIPVELTGDRDRPIYTGEYEEGGEEPALQAPAGGHGEEDEEEFAGNEGVTQGQG